MAAVMVLSVVSPFSRSPLLFSFELLLFAFVVFMQYDACGDKLKAAKDYHRADVFLKADSDCEDPWRR